MRVGVVVFPGSNCDHDTYHVVKHVLGAEAHYVWHKDRLPAGLDAVVLPGGFSYGDYLRCGALARFSPVMEDVVKFAGAGFPVVGICNGFQILCESGLLPGVLLRNASLKFVCQDVLVEVQGAQTPLTAGLQGQRLRIPVAHAEGNSFAAVVCHPHPLFGGTMHNHATYRLAKAVRASGGAALRFQFRGVGRSAGRHDAGRGEQNDTRVALAWLAQRHPDLPRLACGFSFGAWMALEAGCPDPGVRGLLCAGLALSLREVATAAARTCPKPVAVIQAERDEFGAPPEVEAALAGAAGPRRLSVVRGATHLFGEDLAALEREATEALSWLLEGAS